ncbi:MAG: hypothetical protein AB1657_03260 [Candidatus Micrarchaeota archaeon]
MGFDAASAIQQKYAPILWNDELAWKLAIRFRSFHAEEGRTRKNLEMEFKYLLGDLAWERKLEILMDMHGRAKGGERQIVNLHGLNRLSGNWSQNQM